MYKNILLIFILSIVVFAQARVFLKKVWESEPIFKVPESVTYDPTREILYVSNIFGSPLEKDGNGFISKVSLTGEVVDLEWVTELNAPKGSALLEDKLFVTDIDQLIVIDIRTGGKLHTFSDKQAVFLNDVAIDKAGSVYVTDYSGVNSAIYRLKDNEFKIWMRGAEINRPNGIYIADDQLYFGNSGDGKIKSVNLNNNTIRTIADVGSGIDGLKIYNEGYFIVTDWAGKTSLISQSGKISELINTTADKINAADIEYIPGKNLLIIPTFFDNRLFAYQIMNK